MEHIPLTVQTNDGEAFTHIETYDEPNKGTDQNTKLIGVHPTEQKKNG